jgi:hypothetical protein
MGFYFQSRSLSFAVATYAGSRADIVCLGLSYSPRYSLEKWAHHLAPLLRRTTIAANPLTRACSTTHTVNSFWPPCGDQAMLRTWHTSHDWNMVTVNLALGDACPISWMQAAHTCILTHPFGILDMSTPTTASISPFSRLASTNFSSSRRSRASDLRHTAA